MSADPDDQTAARAVVERTDKQVATLRARAALAGFQLHITTGPGGAVEFLMHRWNMTRALPDVAAVEAFLDRAGGPK